MFRPFEGRPPNTTRRGLKYPGAPAAAAPIASSTDCRTSAGCSATLNGRGVLPTLCRGVGSGGGGRRGPSRASGASGPEMGRGAWDGGLSAGCRAAAAPGRSGGPHWDGCGGVAAATGVRGTGGGDARASQQAASLGLRGWRGAAPRGTPVGGARGAAGSAGAPSGCAASDGAHAAQPSVSAGGIRSAHRRAAPPMWKRENRARPAEELATDTDEGSRVGTPASPPPAWARLEARDCDAGPSDVVSEGLLLDS